jgi:hypothetical protein
MAKRPLVGLLVLSCLSGTRAIAYSGGEGTRSSPYLLSCKEDIVELASRPDDFDKSFLLTADIDLDGEVFEHSIVAPNIVFGPSFGEYRALYAGCFNGNGHVIRNFSIAGRGDLGFFGGIGWTGRIMHLGIEDIFIDGQGVSSAGMLASVNMGVIVGCYTQGGIVRCGNAGGLIGYQSSGYVLDCFSQGSIESVGAGTGGLIGVLWEGEIRRCYAATAISPDCSGRGGLAGTSMSGTRGIPYRVVENSFWDTDVSGVSTSVGGLGLSTDEMHNVSTYLDATWDFAEEQDNGINDMWVNRVEGGYPVLIAFSGVTPVVLSGDGTSDHPYAISNARELAALVYYNGMESLCDFPWYALGADIDMSGMRLSTPVLPTFVGRLDGCGFCIRGFCQDGSCGLFGEIEYGAAVLNLCMENCEVTAQDGTVGCLAGENRGLIQDCSVTGIARGGAVTGGLVGSNMGRIWNSSFSGVVAADQKAGGLAGQNAGAMTNGMSRGAVSGDCDVGGVAGSNTGSIRSCYSTAAVAGYSNIGGLVGTNGGTMRDCHARGLVAGADCVGGLVGQNTMQVMRCYSTGSVIGLYDLGGLIGSADLSTGSTSNSLWDLDSSGLEISAGGTGADRSQMQDINTFLDSGWDFVGEAANGTADLWAITEGSYPELTLSLRPTTTTVRR